MTDTELVNHYNRLFEESIKEIEGGNYQIDSLIDSASDDRFGLTLLIRPSDNVKDEIQKFIGELKSMEPDQYYYPYPDIHLTVISIITCYNGFKLENISVPNYIDLIKKSLENKTSFEIDFNGVTASPSCVMIRGFASDGTLNLIRDDLRERFARSNLQQSIDGRYRIQTAHSTVVRFSRRLSNKDKFLKILDKYRNYNFGSFTAGTLELVYNDWYQRGDYVKTLCKFNI